MSDKQLIMALAKVLIAAAWADGDLSYDEINSMKDLLFQLPQLSARRWAVLSMYIETPVGETERARLVEDLQNAIRTTRDKELAMSALDDMLTADGQSTPQEEAAALEVRAAIESADIGIFSGLVKGMTGRRSQAVAKAPNREQYLDDFVKNKVYYGIRRRLDMGEVELDLPEDTLRHLSMAGGMMAQIARVNPQVSDAELATMVDALQTYWHLTPEQSAFVAGVAISEDASQFDRYRLARDFASECTYEERAEFLDVLFAVAAADGMASYEEIEEIRQIAGSLKLAHKQFIEAKLNLPQDKREQ